MPKSKKINSRNKRAREAKAASQNTTTFNQPLNASNPPPSVPIQPTNQNLSISAASAAALPLLQQINSSSTNNAMDTSQNDINDANNQLLDQQQQHQFLQSTSPSTFQQPAPQVPQAPGGGETSELDLLNELYTRIRNYGNSREFFSVDNNMYITIDLNNDTLEELIQIYHSSNSREDFNNLVKSSRTIKYQLHSRIKPGDPVKSSTRTDGICNLWIIFQLDDRHIQYDKRLIPNSFRDDPTKMTGFDQGLLDKMKELINEIINIPDIYNKTFEDGTFVYKNFLDKAKNALETSCINIETSFNQDNKYLDSTDYPLGNILLEPFFLNKLKALSASFWLETEDGNYNILHSSNGVEGDTFFDYQQLLNALRNYHNNFKKIAIIITWVHSIMV